MSENRESGLQKFTRTLKGLVPRGQTRPEVKSDVGLPDGPGFIVDSMGYRGDINSEAPGILTICTYCTNIKT